MNKILLNNFPYLSQNVTASRTTGAIREIKLVHGFDFGLITQENVDPRLASDILQAILVHDVVLLELQNLYDLVRIFGFADVLKLFQRGCIEIIDHQGYTSALIQDGANYGVAFVKDGTEGDSKAYWDRVERNLKQAYPTHIEGVNLLLLQAEAHREAFDTQRADEILQAEINYDLRNQSLTTAQQITSTSNKQILPADMYKVLRLLFLNKSLFLCNSLGAIAMKVDGAIKVLLQQKLSPVMQSGATHDTVALLQKILTEKGIPDLSHLYMNGVLNIEDILAMRENIHGEKFRDWFVSTHYDPAIVQQQLLSKSVSQSVLTKLLRFVIPNAIGIANTPLGVLASAADSFLVEKVIGGWHPNIFLDDVLRAEIDSRLNLHAIKTRRESIRSRFPTVGRNDTCPCGSGKKFKRCCGNGI